MPRVASLSSKHPLVIMLGVFWLVREVGRGGIEPPTFRFSGVTPPCPGFLCRGRTVPRICLCESLEADVVVSTVVTPWRAVRSARERNAGMWRGQHHMGSDPLC